MRLANVLLAVSMIACLLLPLGVSAQLTTMHFATDAELLEYLSDTMFVSEGRIGDRGGAATFELDLGADTGAPATQAQYDWISAQLEPFTLSYDNMTQLVTFSLGGETLYYTTPYFDFEVIFVRTRAVNIDTWVDVYDMTLDGLPVMDSSNAAGSGSGLDILLIYGANLNDGFTLNGTAVLTWIGTPPTQSRLAFQIKVAKLGKTSTEEKSWGAIKSLYR